MYLFVKRLIDVVLVSVGLLAISPILLLTVLVLLLTGEGEVLYRQMRVGRDRRLFPMLKFATMLKDSASMPGGTITVRGDPRITPVGRVLRLTKINELPQLLNILRGEMSLVGPRPLVPASFAKYSMPVQEVITSLKPGLTGIGSLIFRDEELLVTEVKNLGGDPRDYYRDYIYPYKGELELWYASHRSTWVDIALIVLTILKVFLPDSEVAFRIFPSLPKKPSQLTLAGIRKMYLGKA